jgi:hypothetical protein
MPLILTLILWTNDLVDNSKEDVLNKNLISNVQIENEICRDWLALNFEEIPIKFPKLVENIITSNYCYW